MLIAGGGRVSLPWVYMHCAIYETYFVYWFSRDLCLIGGRGLGPVCHGYMCILLFMKLFGVLVFQRSVLIAGVGGDSLPWVYMHSTIHETYLV